VVDYLNRLNPLLARFISLRATTAFLVGQFQGLWNEAMAATSVGNTTAADKLMEQVRRYGAQLKAAHADLAKVAEAIQALGDPPDAAKLKKRNRLQADAAIQYVHDVANGELITKLHECDSVFFKIRGRVSKRTKGNVPHSMLETYNHTGTRPPPGSEDERREWSRTDYSPYDWMETDNITLVSNDNSNTVPVTNIDWYGPVFICSLHVPVSFGSKGASSGTYGTAEATLAFCGVFSEDGQRLIDFYCIATTERREIRNGATVPAHESLLNTKYLLHFEGDKVRHIDPFGSGWLGSGRKDDIFYGASDQPKGEGEVPPPGETAALLRQYLAREDHRVVGRIEPEGMPSDETCFVGPYPQDENVVTSDAMDVLDVQLTGLEFRFFLAQNYSYGASDLPAGGAKEAYSSADELRAEFDNPDLKWATLVTPSSPKGSAEAKLGKMANLIQSVAAEQAADAYRQAQLLAKKEAEALKDTVANYEKDIDDIGKYLAARRADRDRAASGKPSDDTLVRALDYEIATQESEIQAKHDIISSLQNGSIVHTLTPFDELCRGQAQLNAQQDVERLADVDRARRANEALQAKLGEHERQEFVQAVGQMLDAGKGMDPAAWKGLNAQAYEQVQAQLEADKSAADAETAAWERKVWLAEKTATGADIALGITSGAGGYQVAGLLYSFTTSTLNNGLDAYYTTGSPQAGLKAGLFEGTKAVVTGLSSYVDYAWTAAEAYGSGGNGTFHDRMQAAVTAVGGKWLMNQATGYVTEQLAAQLKETPGTKEWRPSAQQSIEAAKYQQQLELDHALARDYLDSYKQMRSMQLRPETAGSPDVARLMAEVRRKACAVNSSYGAKAFIKYAALPVEQRGYSRIMDEVHADLIPQFRQQMREGVSVNGEKMGQWGGELGLAPIRNASSAGTASMDFDLALHQQPDWLPNGEGGLRRNVWLTREGVPASPEQFQAEGQKVWEQLYRRATGYSATNSFENVTTLQHQEAYKDLAWTKVTQPGGADAIDWRWAQQAGDVTRIKHYEMLDNQPSLLHYQKVQESCRGTAKDIKTKVLPLLAEVQKKQNATTSAAEKTHLNEVKTFWSRMQEVMNDYGSGQMQPLEAEHQIYLLSGGRGLDDLTDRVGTAIESLGKAKKK
jgi:hypothetical protein